MAISLRPRQIPEQRLHIVTIEEILSLSQINEGKQPQLEHYFSPTKKEQFIKDYIHYLNTSLLEIKHRKLDINLYLVFVLSFQFIAPLLKIPIEKELGLFFRLLEQRYEVGELDVNIHFSLDEHKEGMLGEKEVLDGFYNELESSFEGKMEVKESVQKRLKQDAIECIMKWQQTKGIPELAEAFGRSIVIPSFFSFTDKKLISFYRSTTSGIAYEVAVPEFE